tara:strand:+ start:265 stop:924 length:660 start_codon:yes stop_codon:yes gene_type:complete
MSILSGIFNVFLPAFILIKCSPDAILGPIWALIIAISLPITWGGIEYIIKKKIDPISVIGILSTLLTGVIGLLKLHSDLIAIKEAMIPLCIGIAILISTKRPFSVIRFIFNQTCQSFKIYRQLIKSQKLTQFKDKISKTSYIFASSFFLSAILNYILAKKILHSATGSVAFNQELGKLTALSYPVIVVPSLIITCLAFWFLIHHIKKLTQLSLDQIIKK